MRPIIIETIAPDVVLEKPETRAYADANGKPALARYDTRYTVAKRKWRNFVTWSLGDEEQERLKQDHLRLVRRASELVFVERRHPPTFRVERERPRCTRSDNSTLTADFAVYDETEKLVAIYEFGGLSQYNKFKFWSENYPAADIYWVPTALASDEGMPFFAVKYPK